MLSASTMRSERIKSILEFSRPYCGEPKEKHHQRAAVKHPDPKRLQGSDRFTYTVMGSMLELCLGRQPRDSSGRRGSSCTALHMVRPSREPEGGRQNLHSSKLRKFRGLPLCFHEMELTTLSADLAECTGCCPNAAQTQGTSHHLLSSPLPFPGPQTRQPRYCNAIVDLLAKGNVGSELSCETLPCGRSWGRAIVCGRR